MPREQLENLARSGSLQSEPPARVEFDGLVQSAHAVSTTLAIRI